jgi:O-antigen/teichoic acid export membrane protein
MDSHTVENNTEFRNSLTHRVARGGIIVVFFAILAASTGYLTRMLYSRSLSIEMFGLFYSILSLMIPLSIFTDLGFGYNLTYLLPKFIKNNEKQKVWNTYKYNQIISLLVSVTLSIILFFLSSFLANYYFKEIIAQRVIKILSLFLIVESFNFSIEKLFIGMQQEEYYASMRVVKLFFTLVFSFIFFSFGKGTIVFYSVSWLAAHLSTSLIYRIVLQIKNKNIFTKTTWDKKLFLTMFKYALPTLFISSFNLISIPIDSLFLIFFKGLGSAGIYNIIIPLAIISPIFLSPINVFLLPLISRLEDEPEKLKQLMDAMLKITSFIAIYFGLFLFLFPNQIVQTMFGSKWMEIAKLPLMASSIGYILLPTSSLLETFASGLGIVRKKAKLVGILTFLKAISSSILIYYLGIIGAIAANLILFSLNIIFTKKYLKKKISFNYPILFYLKIFIFSLTIILLTFLFKISPDGIFQISLVGSIYTCLYLIFGIIAGVIDRKSVMLLSNNKKNIRWFR